LATSFHCFLSISQPAEWRQVVPAQEQPGGPSHLLDIQGVVNLPGTRTKQRRPPGYRGVAVQPGTGVEPGMESSRRGTGAHDPDVPVHESVECGPYPLGFHIPGRPETDRVIERRNAGVGAPGPDYADLAAEEFLQGAFDLALHGWTIGLVLPAKVACAVELKLKPNAGDAGSPRLQNHRREVQSSKFKVQTKEPNPKGKPSGVCSLRFIGLNFGVGLNFGF
jgi:hypothetical protein